MGNNKITVWVFRHGSAKYGMEEDDLTPTGIKVVERQAEKLAKEIKRMENVKKMPIFSSPVNRARHTAKIIQKKLSEHDVDSIIIKESALREIDNFDWKLFLPLIEGGEVEWSGKKFFTDKAKTNPLNINYPSYYVYNCFLRIPAKGLPTGYVEWVKSIERHNWANDRIIYFFLGLQDSSIIVTHDGPMLETIAKKNNGNIKSMKPGSYIKLEVADNGIFLRPNGKRSMINIIK